MPAAVTYTTVLGQVLMENRGGIVTEFVPDPLGSVVKHKDSSGAYVHSAEYWPYGEIQTSTGNLPGPFAYCGTRGYYRDNASQTYVRARYYKPVQGRWMSADIFLRVHNRYKYAANKPLIAIDPDGLKAWYYNCFYKFIYTGDCNADDEVFEAALEGGFEGSTCYGNCMKELNQIFFAAITGGVIVFGGGIPKEIIGITPTPGTSKHTSVASALHYLMCKYGADPGLRPALREIKFAIRACQKNKKACARIVLGVILAFETVFAAICAAKCSSSPQDECDDCSSSPVPDMFGLPPQFGGPPQVIPPPDYNV